MIYFFTGVPGSYKSYSAIAFAKTLAGEDRPVYVHGVSEINVPGWQVIGADEVKTWDTVLPVGAVLLCDEVASLVPQRVKGDPPHWISSLRTHRHRGLDLIFVTQHPMDVDVVFRRLVGEHRHFYRQFGRKKVSWIRSDQVMENPDPTKLLPGQTTESTGVDVSIFKLYKSTALDTHKLRIPRKILYAGAFVLGAILLAYVMIGRFTESKGAPVQMARKPATLGELPPPDPWGGQRPQCMSWSSGSECRCYSQQGNRMLEIGIAECRHIVEYGYFDPSLERTREGER